MAKQSKRCQGTTTKGTQCENSAKDGSDYCGVHGGRAQELRRRQWDVICRVVRRTGVLTRAAEAAGIDRKTLYRWEDQHPEFAKRLRDAREHYAEIDDDAIVEAFRAQLLETIRNPEETWTTENYAVEDDGTEKLKSKRVKRVRRGPPKWAMDLALPKVEGRSFGAGTADLGSTSDLSPEEAGAQMAAMLGVDFTPDPGARKSEQEDDADS